MGVSSTQRWGGGMKYQSEAFVLFLSALSVILDPSARASQSEPRSGSMRATSCVYPDPQKLLGPQIVTSYEKADYLFFNSPNGLIRWLFVSFEAPKDGVLFILSCDGRVISIRELGWVDRLEIGPSINGQATAEVVYVTATGTGVYEE